MKNVFRAAHLQLAVHHRDGGWNGALSTHNGLHLTGGVQVGRKRHAVGHNGGLQGHDRPPFGKGILHLFGHRQPGRRAHWKWGL